MGFAEINFKCLFNKVELLLITYIEVEFRPFMSIFARLFIIVETLETWFVSIQKSINLCIR